MYISVVFPEISEIIYIIYNNAGRKCKRKVGKLVVGEIFQEVSGSGIPQAQADNPQQAVGHPGEFTCQPLADSRGKKGVSGTS
ncbi:hypothetical protein CEE37_00005 [candidate division LCP-89 bacterium B3_LCP]|uniref:Uncharacterized protein n=1 Tax=candidate division LCP-89 bacterium B3_LCP TaxID=2012998 RepID=A0A532V4G2_UNCL8|nr:MAG: hypothetical protein CEE37_00005 [candidate division LCP-89 bacterium B3_LCP]